MNGLRINMVINCDEHPELHAMLTARTPKVRAAVLRQFAEFGIWAKGKGGSVQTTNQELISEPVKPVAAAPIAPIPATLAQAPASTSKPVKASVVVEALQPIEKVSAAPILAAPVLAAPVLDATVLSGFDFGGLD